MGILDKIRDAIFLSPNVNTVAERKDGPSDLQRMLEDNLAEQRRHNTALKLKINSLGDAVVKLAVKTGVEKTGSVLGEKSLSDLVALCEKMEDKFEAKVPTVDSRARTSMVKVARMQRTKSNDLEI